MPSTTAYGQQPMTKKNMGAPETCQDELQPVRDFMHYLREYAKENPEVAALTCVSVGFVLGWKLKMW